MGAYIALRLTEIYPVGTLILTIPGMYSRAAYRVPFGPQFSEILRAPGSWQDSDAWEIIHNFRGNLLIVRAGNDQVIPGELIDRLFASADQVRSKEMLVVPESGHNVYPYLENKEYFDEMIHPILSKMISNGVEG
jgi:hypothetical protein